LDGLRRLGVAGWPVAHSRSPAMHNAALQAVGLERWRYQLLPLPPALFVEAVRALAQVGFAGINVTIPHKEAALGVADEASEAARAIGAANTLTFGEDRIHADNTDAPGLLAALGDARPASAVVLGAGGSARAVVHALSQLGAAVYVWNRDAQRARSLASEFGAEAVQDLPPPAADLLVNCTSVGLVDPSSTFKDLPLRADALGEYACVVDLVYRAGGTGLLREARRRGAQVIDGIEVLVHQGALSFERWTGRAAPLEVMRRAARGTTFPHDDPRNRPPVPAPDGALDGPGGRGGDRR
jgi:shikimate dehydrogenase